jgi:hypothetical protein
VVKSLPTEKLWKLQIIFYTDGISKKGQWNPPEMESFERFQRKQ